VRHAVTEAVRTAAFPQDEPLTRRGARQAIALRTPLQHVREGYASPSVRARQTAAAAGLEVRDEPALAECDFGSWRGRTLAEVHAEDPEAVRQWMTQPQARPHGGETLFELVQRVGAWLDAQAQLDGVAAAVTHGGPLKAAVVHALGAPLEAFWRIDASPLGLTELHAHDGSWTLVRLNWLAARDAGDDAPPRAAGRAEEPAIAFAAAMGGGGGR
jgi:broad specificity phosphatase PhoE